MNDTTTVPADIFADIKGKDVKVVLDLGNGIKWTIDGKDVTSVPNGQIDFDVQIGTNGIPVEIVNNVTGERYSMQISLNHDGEFGFKAVLTINLEKKNAGYYANLFYYNVKTKELEFMTYGKINEDGSVDLDFNHASDYVIVIDDKPLDGSAQTGAPVDKQKNSAKLNAKAFVAHKGTKLSLTWGKVEEADGYDIFAAQCGKELSAKAPAVTVKGQKTSVDLTKIAGKEISDKKTYKVRIKAYKLVDGKKTYIGSSLLFHAVGKQNKTYTNAKKVELSKTSVTLNQGKTKKIKAAIVKQSPKKKLLTREHGDALRYFSMDTGIATVTADGKIEAKNKGTCYVYVTALNGRKAKVKVTVK